MKSHFVALGLIISFSTNAAQWIEMGTDHPLWKALSVEAQTEDHPFLKVEKKVLGKLECTQTTLPSLSPMTPAESQTHCLFPDDFSSQEAQKLFENIALPASDTTGAFTEYKAIGKMIIVGSDDSEEGERFARVHFNHPCTKVFDQESANSCVKFFATEVLPSFEEVNTTATLSNGPAVTAKALNSMKVFGSQLGSLENSEAELLNIPFIGMMVEHIYAGRHFTYFAVEKGENRLPKEIMNFNMEDFSWYVEDIIAGMAETELEIFTRKLVKDLYLGLPTSTFPDLTGDIAEGMTY